MKMKKCIELNKKTLYGKTRVLYRHYMYMLNLKTDTKFAIRNRLKLI